MPRPTDTQAVQPVCPNCGERGHVYSEEKCWADFPVLVDPMTGEIDGYGEPEFSGDTEESYLRCRNCRQLVDEIMLRA